MTQAVSCVGMLAGAKSGAIIVAAGASVCGASLSYLGTRD